ELSDLPALLAELPPALEEPRELLGAGADLLAPRLEGRRRGLVPLAHGLDRLRQPAQGGVHASLLPGGLRGGLGRPLDGLLPVEGNPARGRRQLLEAAQLALEDARRLGEVPPALPFDVVLAHRGGL